MAWTNAVGKIVQGKQGTQGTQGPQGEPGPFVIVPLGSLSQKGIVQLQTTWNQTQTTAATPRMADNLRIHITNLIIQAGGTM